MSFFAKLYLCIENQGRKNVGITVITEMPIYINALFLNIFLVLYSVYSKFRSSMYTSHE
jgi:hypothetical protein